MTKDHANGDNPEVGIELYVADNEYYGNDSDDYDNNAMRVYSSYPKHKRNQKEEYIPSHEGQQYKQVTIHI